MPASPTAIKRWAAINSESPYFTSSFASNSSHSSTQPLTVQRETSVIELSNMSLPPNTLFRGTFAMSEAEKYPNARAGFPMGPVQSYQHDSGITFEAAPMADAGPIGSGIPTPRVPFQAAAAAAEEPSNEAVTPAVPTNGRSFGTELNSEYIAEHTNRPSGSPRKPIKIVQAPRPLVRTFQAYLRPMPTRQRESTCPPIPTTPTGRSRGKKRASTSPSAPKLRFKKGKKVQPTTPVLAKPYPPPPKTKSGSSPPPPAPSAHEVEQRLPDFDKRICSCKRSAGTHMVRVVQCWNPDCMVGWYHYMCLNKSAKLSSLHGKWMCGVCKDEKAWGEAKGETDMRMPFRKEEVLEALDEMFGTGGKNMRQNPYGFGMDVEMEDGKECL